jgi:hypothetical protein
MIILDNFISTRWAITTNYRAIGSNKEGVITNAYGPQQTPEKESFLHSIWALSTIIGNIRWIIRGNLILSSPLMRKEVHQKVGK